MWRILKRTGSRGSDRTNTNSSNKNNNNKNNNNNGNSDTPKRRQQQQNSSPSRGTPQSSVHDLENDTTALSSNRGLMRRNMASRRSFNTGRREATSRRLEVDAAAEREIADAACRLGESIQKVVLDAKQGKQAMRHNGNGGPMTTPFPQDEWRTNLLQVLGGSDADVDEKNGHGAAPSDEQRSDVDILLNNSHCDKFILRCMENELPPNLIHCIRLLRVLELQNSTALDGVDGAEQGSGNSGTIVKPVSKNATKKVERLLCLLCGDTSVGEQLRPHLFGLLALSGARYPANAIHVAKAASNVVVAFSKDCFSTSIVWFLHERNLIVHMTDDVKELCGMSSMSTSTTPTTSCLFGKDAESHGLWLFSLTAIVSMVREACEFNCIALLRDFESAGGYQVLRHAIGHSSEANLKKLLGVAATMIYCNIECEDDDGLSMASSVVTDLYDDNHPRNETHLAINPDAFELIEDLMEHSMPLLARYGAELADGVKMEINTREHIRALAKYSLELSLLILEMGYQEDEEDMDRNLFGSEIVECTMQIYSDHPLNFSIIEGRYDVLTKYLLAFPTFDEIKMKHVVLRLFEYACTGLPEADCWKPLTVASDVFYSICKNILRLSIEKDQNHENKASIERLRVDARLLMETLEKLLQVDESSLGKIMLEAGIMGEVLHEMLTLLMMVPTRQKKKSTVDNYEEIDEVYCSLCRIIDLIFITTFGMASISSPRLDSPQKSFDTLMPSTNRSVEVDAFLTLGMTELSLESCCAACQTFESKMRFSETNALMEDVDCIVRILNNTVFSVRSSSSDDVSRNKCESIMGGCEILGMLKRVLCEIDSAQDAFRLQGGFEVLLLLLFCLEDSHNNDDPDINSEDNDDLGDAIFLMVKGIYGVFDAATKVSSSSCLLAASRAVDLLSEQHDGISKNREYINANGFYESLVKALRGVGLFDTPRHALAIMNLSLGLLHPELRITLDDNEEDINPAKNVNQLQNPDASKLVLGMAISLPKDSDFRKISSHALNVLIELCSSDRAGTTLEQITNCGLSRTLVSDDGFSFIFDDFEHPLYPRFVALLRRVASFKMTHMDFVALLRFIALPLITATQGQCKDRSELRLPIISSSFNAIEDKRSGRSKLPDDLERTINYRLQTMSVIAKRCDRVARCYLGGAKDINKMFFSKGMPENAGLDERLYTMAEEGIVRFVEIDTLQARSKRATTSETNNGAAANLWSPTSTTGFSYSLWLRLPGLDEGSVGNVCILDLSSNMDGSRERKKSSGRQQFLSIWYDLTSQQFNVICTGSTKPSCFPTSTLSHGVWHHIMVTYQPPKRAVLSRKAVIGLCVDGRALEKDVKVDAVALSPNSIMYVGVPNPILAFGGTIKGSLPFWELGSMLLVSQILGPRDAVSIFSAGPEFHGQFWGDRPQRLSLSATATSVFSMLALANEKGGIAGSLRKRSIPEIEGASHVMRDKVSLGPVNRSKNDSVTLGSVGLFCDLLPEYIICAFHPSSSTQTMREDSVAADKGHFSRRLVNVAEIHSTNDLVSSDAIVYGIGSVVCPISFGDNVQWLGGPNVLLPMLHAAKSTSTIALTLRVVKESARGHIPNLEMLQSGGGYAMLALLLIQKHMMNAVIFEHCVAFAVNGFEPETFEEAKSKGADHDRKDTRGNYSWPTSDDWALVDLDALKHLVKNHQVWHVQSSGPDLSLRAMCLLNGLVTNTSKHCQFNARRLHILGMVKWTIHLMLEVSELFTYGDIGDKITKELGGEQKTTNELLHTVLSAYRYGWVAETAPVRLVSPGGDPGVPLLLACKSFLRGVLAHMLTPDDLGDIAGAIIYSLKKEALHEDLAGQLGQENTTNLNRQDDLQLSMGSVTRIYLLRLLEELVVDGVNKISASSPEARPNSDNGPSNIQDFSAREISGNNAQMFLSAFAEILTPVWFVCLLVGCRDESSASAAFRLMIIMLQNCPSFSNAFQKSGGFAPFVLSIPKYSTSPSILLAMLSQLLHAPLLHLPCLGELQPEQLCAVFDTESDDPGLILLENDKGGVTNSESTDGIFYLLAECLGRNIQIGAADTKVGNKARKTNEAVIILLTHRHSFSTAFQQFCKSPGFLEPMAQALCLVHNHRIISKSTSNLSCTSTKSGEDVGFYDWPTDSIGTPQKVERRGHLNSIDVGEEESSPTRRFVGDAENNGGVGLVRLLRHIINHAVFSGPKAVELVAALFRSFPIFASHDEVEAFHMVLIEQCHATIEDALQRGELIAIANCVGISSLLLDRLLMGFFTSQPILQALETILSTLNAISVPDTYAYRTLQKEDTDNIIRTNAAHFARLTCVVALQRSKPAGHWDSGDEILQQRIVTRINRDLEFLLFASPMSPRASSRNGNFEFGEARGTQNYSLWQSTSLKRCDIHSESCKFPEIAEVIEPDRSFIIAIMSEVHSLLQCKNRPLSEETSFLMKSLLRQRHGIMSDLLIRDVPMAGGVVKLVDLLNGGGFGALIMHNANKETNDESIEELRLQTFFDWMEVTSNDITEVFESIGREALQCFPSIFSILVPSPQDAIEQKQKEMLVKFASKEKSDITIARRQDRVTLTAVSNGRTDISQDIWKRQGMDDLSTGGMMWKSLLRQLKGSRSVWEGGSRSIKRLVFSKEELLSTLSRNSEHNQPHIDIKKKDVHIRWKLDMSEGYERQRKKFLPNYEFNALYNVEEVSPSLSQQETKRKNVDSEVENGADLSLDSHQISNGTGLYINPDGLEATADLLKKMDIGAIKAEENEDVYEDDDEVTIKISEVKKEGVQSEICAPSTDANAESDASVGSEDSNSDDEAKFDQQQQNHYDLIQGLLQTGDVIEKSYNVQRCTGLEVCKALLAVCHDSIYIIDGFEQSDNDGLKGKINKVEKAVSTFRVNIRSKDYSTQHSSGAIDDTESKKGETCKKKMQVKANSSDMSRYQNRCKRLSYQELFGLYRRRYQLQQIALEFYDSHSNGTFIAFTCNKEREEVLNVLLHSSLPNSIFNSGPGTSPNYDKFMKSLRSKITNQWVQGKMTNFDFLMHLNSFAGRSYNDLTQYPVFPWIIADYDSEEIDLHNPNIYRDLSCPMGALGLARAEQFSERYDALQSNHSRGDELPAFHYGTHYSCAAYVLNYMLRLEPYSRLALSLQGGKFDLADRLFHNIGGSWKSASRDNFQDVRELIPEFFYLPEFLENGNSFDLGVKQDGTSVHDVVLPPWAKGDPRRFVRINRQALESEHVSRNLHKWIDLVFGYKQRGREAVKSLNTFVHVTYEGSVDINSIEDPIQRESIIAQIQNFGITPSRLECRPFPSKNALKPVKDMKSIDFTVLPLLEPMTPPFCIVGCPHVVHMRVVMDDVCKVGMMGQTESSVGDMCLSKGQLVGVGKTCALLPSVKKYYRFGGSNNGISVHVAIATFASARNWDVNRVLTIHDDMHRAPITAIQPSRDATWLVTGCMDSTVRVWKCRDDHMELQATLCGHDGGKITCIAICTTFGTIITGADDSTVLMWDLRTLSFLRELDHATSTDKRAMPTSVESVSLNHKTGDALVLVDTKMSIFDINGNFVAGMSYRDTFSGKDRPCCAILTDCPEWMDNGVVAITGHIDGAVLMWGINRDKNELFMRHIIEPKLHECAITCLKIEGKRQDTLLCGDTSGKMTMCKTIQLEALNQKDLAIVLGEC